MPKRKVTDEHSPHERPPRKKRKKVPQQDAANDESKGKKSSTGAAAERRDTVSANWLALRTTLGLSSVRKKDQPAAKNSSDVATSSKRRGRKRHQLGNDRKKPPEKAAKKKPDIWFDDVDLDFVNGEPVAKIPSEETTCTCTSPSLITGPDKSIGRCVAVDCEMVGTGPDGQFSMLARCCVVNHHGHILYDTFVAPMDKVTDYRTRFSGISRRDLAGAPEFSEVQRHVSELLKDRVLVGHAIQNDLKALLLSHPKKDIRDTSKYRSFKAIAKTRYPSLKKLAKEILGRDIQVEEHNPVEDAQVAMKLYHLHRREWEEALRVRLTRREARERRKKRKGEQKKPTEKGPQRRPPEDKPFNIMLHTDR